MISSSPKLPYRPEIDGLRAIAVISVTLYHAEIVFFGINIFEGGFIGVDIFFVISGYLITRILLIELQNNNHFHFANFYERRARRILPMLFVVILVSIPFAWQKLLPIDLVEYAQSALSALFFTSNFFFYFTTTEYGADSALRKPLLHTWSLGIEEQFYVIIPIVLLVIWKLSRAFLLPTIIGLLLVSLVFAEVMSTRNSELNFFLPFSRFWELLFGSVLAKIEIKYGRLDSKILSNMLSILGLSLIFYSIVVFNSSTAHPSFYTLIPVIGVSLIIAFSSHQDMIGKLLSTKSFVGIGLISYSVYLWHFPIFAFSRIGATDPSNYDKLGWIVATFGLATISYFSIEKPFRNKQQVGTKTLLASLIIIALALGFINWHLIRNDGYAGRLPSILLKGELKVSVADLFKQNGARCFDRKKEFCSIDTSPDALTIYAFGDSHFSAMAMQILEFVDGRFNYVEANVGGCPFILGVNRYKRSGEKDNQCSSGFQKQRLNLVETKPSVILIGGRFPLYLSSMFFDNKEGGVEGKEWDEFRSANGNNIEDEFKNTLRVLTSLGHHIILVYPIPEVGWNVPTTLLNKIKGLDVAHIKSTIDKEPITTSFAVYKERTRTTFDLFDSIVHPNIHRVYPHKVFCNSRIQGRCVTHNSDDVFYVDDDHPSSRGSEMIVELIGHKINKAEKVLTSK